MRSLLGAIALLAALAGGLAARAEDEAATDWSKAQDVAAALARAVRVEVGDPFHRWGLPVDDTDVRRNLARVTAEAAEDAPPPLADVGVRFVLPDGTPVRALVRGERIDVRDPTSGEWRTFGIAAGVLGRVRDVVERARFHAVRTVEQAAALPADTLAVAVEDPSVLPALAHLRDLRALSFFGAVTDDADLARIPELPRLEYLYLRGMSGYGTNEVSDAGAAHLARLTTLRSLSIGATQVGDGGMRHLSALTRLERLEIGGCPVTVAGLAHLRKTLPALRDLDLHAANDIRLEELADLSPALTQCRIVLPWGERTTGAKLPALLRELRTLRSFTGTGLPGDDAVHRLVRGARDWRTLWAETVGAGDAPAVDFETEAVIAVVTAPVRAWDGMTLSHVVRQGEYHVTYHVSGPSGVDPGKRRVYGFFVVPHPRRDIRLFASRKAGPGPAFVEKKALFSRRR